MRNTNSKVRCEKRQMSKCREVVRTYNQLQSKFAEMLSAVAFIEKKKVEKCNGLSKCTRPFYLTLKM